MDKMNTDGVIEFIWLFVIAIMFLRVIWVYLFSKK